MNGPQEAQLRALQDRYEEAMRDADHARDQRDQLIRELVAAGSSHMDVYRALEGRMTRARIGQIAKGVKR